MDIQATRGGLLAGGAGQKPSDTTAVGQKTPAPPQSSPQLEPSTRKDVDLGLTFGPVSSAEAESVFNAKAQGQSADRLTPEEQAMVDQLRARDREVRDHEQAHARVGGPYAGNPSYTYQTGPDGQRYAIGGEVSIDIAPVADDPEATVQKMDVVKAAALAPAEPSSQDRRVAAIADTQRMQALADLAALRSAVNQSEAEPQVDFAA